MEQILIVEDEALISEYLSDVLVDLGYEVEACCSNAKEALGLVERVRPDLVLLDINLKGSMDGIEVARRLRSDHDLPFLYITAQSDQATVERARDTDPLGYLIKPINPDDLRVALELAFYRRNADVKRRQMETWLTTTLDSIGDGVIALDPQRRISYLNLTAERLTGWSLREATGQHFSEVFSLVGGDMWENCEQLVEDCYSSGKLRRLEGKYGIRRRDGSVLPIDDSIAPIGEGAALGLVIVFRDRTHLHKLEQEREELMRKNYEKQRLETLGLLAAGIAHDFNNLLTIVRGNADLCQEMKCPGQSDYLAEVVLAAERGAELCDQMLSYAGRAVLEPKSLDLRELLEQCLPLVRRFKPKCKIQMLETSGSFQVLGDRSQLQQVVLNLVINAAESYFPTDGPVSVLLGQAGGMAVLEIFDQGCGISAEAREKIFEPFYSTKQTGRGLGLAAVAGIVRAHRGELLVESTPGKGSTFCLRLPICQEKSGVPVKRLSSRIDLRGKRILVADDEEAIRTFLQLALSRAGALVLEASDGDRAWDLLQGGVPFHLVILDVVMPGLTGREIAQRLERESSTPVLLISGYEPSQAEGSQTRLLSKPFGLVQFFQAVAEVLST